jgi:carbamoyl-phosphate synthase small subunit
MGRQLCQTPSNCRSEYPLDRFLKEHHIPGICGVDTRDLTLIIREEGVMNALICSEPPADLTAVKSYAVRDGVKAASCKAPQCFPAEGEEKFHVALLDYGAKHHIVENLQERGCRVTVLPHDTGAEAVLALRPDGLMLSNGPGDPKENSLEIQELQKLIGKLPVFGICLGHQLTALAMGGKTVKLKYGHHGANQPVTDGSHTWITSQNHNYAVLADSLAGKAECSFWNVNDRSCEGLRYPGLRCSTVQFHPEAAGGPHDLESMFDSFLAEAAEEKRKKEAEGQHAEG